MEDLSSPAGFSINDGISQKLLALVNLVGGGALLVKADIKEAYRIITCPLTFQLIPGHSGQSSPCMDIHRLDQVVH